MFLSKQDFEESISLMNTYENISTPKDISISIAKTFAREIFEDFERMIDDDKKQVIEMIIEDISANFLNIN